MSLFIWKFFISPLSWWFKQNLGEAFCGTFVGCPMAGRRRVTWPRPRPMSGGGRGTRRVRGAGPRRRGGRGRQLASSRQRGHCGVTWAAAVQHWGRVVRCSVSLFWNFIVGIGGNPSVYSGYSVQNTADTSEQWDAPRPLVTSTVFMSSPQQPQLAEGPQSPDSEAADVSRVGWVTVPASTASTVLCPLHRAPPLYSCTL